MAFASAIVGKTIMGNKRVHWGTWTTDTTTGDIETGLRQVESMILQPYGAAAVSADAATLGESLPVAGNAVTIFVTSGIDGTWLAIGV